MVRTIRARVDAQERRRQLLLVAEGLAIVAEAAWWAGHQCSACRREFVHPAVRTRRAGAERPSGVARIVAKDTLLQRRARYGTDQRGGNSEQTVASAKLHSLRRPKLLGTRHARGRLDVGLVRRRTHHHATVTHGPERAQTPDAHPVGTAGSVVTQPALLIHRQIVGPLPLFGQGARRPIQLELDRVELLFLAFSTVVRSAGTKVATPHPPADRSQTASPDAQPERWAWRVPLPQHRAGSEERCSRRARMPTSAPRSSAP
ncbi:MAG: hypothetical protein ACJ0UT_00890 [Candidatus Latescibacterota bacterium]